MALDVENSFHSRGANWCKIDSDMQSGKEDWILTVTFNRNNQKQII